MLNFWNNSPIETNETQTQKPKAVLILGALWTGKTQFLNTLLPHVELPYRIIVNDIWSINVDMTRFWDKPMESLQKWCICCDDDQGFQKIIEKLKDSNEILFIEPSGIAGGWNLTRILEKAWFDINIVTLVDVEHFEQRSEAQKQIMKTQVEVANIIWLTWIWKNEQQVLDWIHDMWKKSPIHIPNISENFSPEFYKNLIKEILDFWNKKEKIIKPWYSIISNWENTYKRLVPGWSLFGNSREKNPMISESFQTEKNISLADLEKIIDFFWTQLVRAKWEITWYEFDFVHGSINIRKKETQNNFFTLISENKIPKDFLNILYPEILTQTQSDEKIQQLVADYHKYMDLEAQIEKLVWLINSENKYLDSVSRLESEKKVLWDSMKYQNPYVWLQYKLQAYKDSPKAIITIWDLKKHCEEPTYICHKRLQFLSNILLTQYNIDIFDESLEDLDIQEVIWFSQLMEISQNENHMQNWSLYEFYSINGETAKWENFNT